MTDQHQHRATPEQWNFVDTWGVIHDDPNASCILELRDRIAALEAAAAMTELRAASAEARPAVSLVERVEKAVYDKRTLDDLVRTAILEVAAWLRERSEWVGSDMLEQEATNG